MSALHEHTDPGRRARCGRLPSPRGTRLPGGGCGGVGLRPGPTCTRITHRENLKSYKKARQQSSGIYLGGGLGVGGWSGGGPFEPPSPHSFPSPPASLPHVFPAPSPYPPRFAQARLADDGALGLTRALASGQPGNQEATTAAAAHGKTPCSRRKRRGCDAHTRQVDTHYFCHTARTRTNRGTHTNTHTGTQAHKHTQKHKHTSTTNTNAQTQKHKSARTHNRTQTHRDTHTGTQAHRHTDTDTPTHSPGSGGGQRGVGRAAWHASS